MRKNLSESKGALSVRQRLKRRRIYDRDIQLKEIDWVFQIPSRRDFAPGFTALFSTIGALRAPLSFTAFGGKIQATRSACGR